MLILFLFLIIKLILFNIKTIKKSRVAEVNNFHGVVTLRLLSRFPGFGETIAYVKEI